MGNHKAEPRMDQWGRYMRDLRDAGHLTEFGRGFLAGVEAHERSAGAALSEQGILGTRLDEIRARANAGQPLKAFDYYRANGMWDALRPFIEEAQQDRISLLAAVDALPERLAG